MHNCFRSLNRLEFVVTMACTGKCKHCSEGDHSGYSGCLDADKCARLIRHVCDEYNIKSLMTFGGEPLLFPEVVYEIHQTAKVMGIPARQIITNGFFSRNEKKILSTAEKLAACGVNEILLSVDAFHQETIPLEYVKRFARMVKDCGVAIQAHPAWLVSAEDNNPYNIKTREILREISDMGINASEGNVIFPGGNALKYLGEYFDKDKEYINPYDEDPTDVHSICVSSNGNVLSGNIYEKDINDIMAEYEMSFKEKYQKL